MSYPAMMNKLDNDTIADMTDIWCKFFEDDDYSVVEDAVKQHISTKTWMPTIAEIREKIVKLTRCDLIPPDRAWCAVKQYLYIRDSYIQLPKLIGKVVETIGTSTLKELRNGNDKKQFMELYIPAYNRELEKAMFPKALSERITKYEEAFGGEALKAIEQISEASENERKTYEEAFNRQYASLENIALC